MGSAKMGGVLLVDDEQEVAEALKAYLELRGFSCTVASSGPEALKRIAQQRPDIVLLDVQLGEGRGGGLEVLREAKAEFPALRVFMVTSCTDAALRALAQSLGAEGYLEKPLTAERIFQVLKDPAPKGGRGTLIS